MKCDLGDFAIFYETYGAGRPIVMLPGRPSDHHSMARFMEPLFTQRDGWLRIYPDLPGTGLTPGLDRLATHDQMLGAMLAFIDKVIPGQRFVLACVSYGGYLARGVVAHKAELIDGLLLCVPLVKVPPSLPPRTTLVANPQLLSGLDPDEAQTIESIVVVQTSTVVEGVREVLAEIQKADHAFGARLEASAPASFETDTQPTLFGGPTLILAGRQDNVCGYRDVWDLLENYPRATFAVLDRAGHFIHIEQDGLCYTLVNEWLDRVEEYSSV